MSVKKTALTLAILCAVTPAVAGVVYTIETTFPDGSGKDTTTGTMSVEGGNLRMQLVDAKKGRNTEMIFRHWGDPHENLNGKHTGREMVMVNHDDKTYIVLDEATMQQLAAQINQAMSAMEQAMAAVPESQRAKMKEMMKGRMPMQMDQREPSELKKTGVGDTVNGYPCSMNEVWRGSTRERAMCVTAWANIEGSEEVVDVFRDMSAFLKEMLDSLPEVGGMRNMADESFAYLEELNGFPVMTRELDDDGSVEFQSTLVASKTASLPTTDFEPPKGYKRQELMKGKNR